MAGGEEGDQVRLTVDGGASVAMSKVNGEVGVWTADALALGGGGHKIQVSATLSKGAQDDDIIGVCTPSPGSPTAPTLKPQPGTHVHSIGAWPGW